MLQDAWDAVVDVAANTPHASQQLLVEILCAVQGEDLSTQFPEKVIVWGERVKMFEDLPLFGPSLRTAWNQIPGSGSQRCFTPEQWTNINAFVARLTALSSSLPVFDYSLYAIWSLRAVFEETEVDEALASAGEVWLQYSRAAIEKLSCAEKTFEGRLAAPGSKFRDKDWVGFNMERLGIWQAALELHSK
ncbi:hypothetical protein BJ878DRAFT_413222 [Calycina marina]|uniref:Uncharacterized protein n=1 Tax=Calycina marina TaxID=1763456 RepID=A0A9P7ZB41_9HELO|nr:hypothetical protein BJ878DRAFT_413222 [Calycina marina]